MVANAYYCIATLIILVALYFLLFSEQKAWRLIKKFLIVSYIFGLCPTLLTNIFYAQDNYILLTVHFLNCLKNVNSFWTIYGEESTQFTKKDFLNILLPYLSGVAIFVLKFSSVISLVAVIKISNTRKPPLDNGFVI